MSTHNSTSVDSPLLAGSLSDCKRLVKQFEIKISDPTTADYDKRTPLHLAAAEGHIDVVNWLLSKLADLNPIDRFKRTPLEEAVRSDYGSIVSLLIQHKAKVVGPDGNLVDLALSHLSGNVNVIDSNFTPGDSLRPFLTAPTNLTTLFRLGHRLKCHHPREKDQ